MDAPVKKEQYKQMAQTNIQYLLDGEKPRLIDEWQVIPQFWDAIRFIVDHNKGDGHICLRGLPFLLIQMKYNIQAQDDLVG